MEKELITEARAKINWTLQIVGRRADGYHLLDSIMQRIDLSDQIIIRPHPTLTLNVIGADPSVPSDERNLIIRAALALQKHAGVSRGAAVTLSKNIPSGAGLGGGSADAAAALLALNTFWDLHYPISLLETIGAGLGADIPYCMHPVPMRVGGIGEKLAPLPFPVRSFPLVLLKGSDSLSTKDIYRRFDALERPSEMQKYADEWLSWISDPSEKPVSSAWNDLEMVSLPLDPTITRAKRDLYTCGARFAQMTGSGSAVYGMFLTEAEARRCADTLGQLYSTCLVCRTC